MVKPYHKINVIYFAGSLTYHYIFYIPGQKQNNVKSAGATY
jgi:hypothetical protein